MNRIVLFKDKESNETQYGVLIKDDLNGDYILCFCCLQLFELKDCEIIEDDIELKEDLSVLVEENKTN